MTSVIKTFSKKVGSVFKSGSSVFVSGPPFFGKTYFIQKVLLNRHLLFNTFPEKIMIVYKEWQDSYTVLTDFFGSKISFVTLSELPDLKKMSNLMIIFDDIIQNISDEIIECALIGVHHRSLCIFFLTQSIYYNEKLKFLRKNCNMYIFLSPLESVSIFRLLSNDLTKEQLKRFKSKFNIPMKVGEYSHLIYTRDVTTPAILRFKFDIFCKIDNPSCIYEYKCLKIFE
jgi:hypothetical protein